jgi:hypothetical protein
VDPRNAGRQKYCAKPDCRKASKAASQRQWNQKAENQDSLQRTANTKRVREWRVANPGYWRRAARSKSGEKIALQETLNAQTVDCVSVARPLQDALQDCCPAQTPVIVGLVAFLSGLGQQEHIAEFMRKLSSRGQDILCMSPGRPLPPHHENETYSVSKTKLECA